MRALVAAWKFLPLGLALFLLSPGTARVAIAQSTPAAGQAAPIHISGYRIDVTLDPGHHSIAATAVVTFAALQNLAVVPFELNSALHIRSVADGAGQSLSAARSGASNAVLQVTPTVPLKTGDEVAWTFTYDGAFDREIPASQSNRPAAIRYASIDEPVSYLLYAARWFPMAGYLTDRFTMTIQVHVPAGELVLGSGLAAAPHRDPNGLTVFHFAWPVSGFPGTILAGKFREVSADGEGAHVSVYLIDTPGTAKINGKDIAAAAQQEYNEFAAQFGPADSHRLNVVELPDNTAPAYWAPEIAAISARQMNTAGAARLLTNTIAHQWWGNDVSPATLNDAWITNGMCRFAELESLQHNARQAAFHDAILNVSASALAYSNGRLGDVAQDPAFSPEFQAMTYDKGAMIFRMLEWQMGDAAFDQTLHSILSRTDRSISAAELETLAGAASHQNLQPFFTQWLDDSGAPTLQDNWTLYRLGGKNAGYRTVGEITDNMDLFRMPVEVRIVTASKTVNQRVNIAGAQSQFVIHTAGMPSKILLDPDRWLLRSDPAMQVRVHILRGQQMAARNDADGAIREYRQALAIDDISSLASYRLGELYFLQRNYQAAENAFRDALHGDGLPKWTEVWSDLELGKIFDASGQRERAVNQYREALQTGDDTGGAVTLARGYLAHPYNAVGRSSP